jgi:hypothetical protein
MNAEDKFWVALWSLAALVICTLAITVSLVSANKSRVLYRMVAEQRADPLRASCALDISDRSGGVCAILAASRQPY